LLLVVLP